MSNPDEDVLIGGASSLESGPSSYELASEAALRALLEEWNSSMSRSDRELALDPLVLSITDDGDEDKLTGSSGEDWFIPGIGDIITDGNNGNGNGRGNGRN